MPLYYFADLLMRRQERRYREGRAKHLAEHQVTLDAERHDPTDEDPRRDDQSEHEGGGYAP